MNDLPVPEKQAEEQVDVLMGTIYNLTYDQAKTRIELRDALTKRTEVELKQARTIKDLECSIHDLQITEKDLRARVKVAEDTARKCDSDLRESREENANLSDVLGDVEAERDELLRRRRARAKRKRHAKN